MDDNSPYWVLVNESKGGQCFVDRRSVRYPGGQIRALVADGWNDPEAHESAGKKVVPQIYAETFWPDANRVLIGDVWFEHVDCSETPVVATEEKWIPVEDRAVKTLDYLKTLGEPILPSDLLRRRLTPIIALGIVNPMGPTFGGLCLLEQGRGQRPDLVRFMLNPFRHEAVALREANHVEACDPARLLEEVGIGWTTAGTFALFAEDVGELRRLQAAQYLAHTRTDLERRVRFLRASPRDPWRRVAAEAQYFRTGSLDMLEASIAGGETTAALVNDDVAQLLDDEAWSEEPGAFAKAWQGSIDFQRSNGSHLLANGAMPLD